MQTDFTVLVDALKGLSQPKPDGGCANVNRRAIVESQIQLLENPPSPLVDSPAWIAYSEEQLLGIAITCSKIDSCDVSQVNCSCKEFASGRTGFLILGVEIQEEREIKTKKGKTPGSKMGRLTISDGTCAIEAVIFPEQWKEYRNLLTRGNTVIIQGEQEKSKEYNSLIVKKVWQACHNQ